MVNNVTQKCKGQLHRPSLLKTIWEADQAAVGIVFGDAPSRISFRPTIERLSAIQTIAASLL